MQGERWFRLSVVAVAASMGLTAAAPASAQPAPQAAQPPAQKVDPSAVKALSAMSAYLQSLSTFELKTQTALDLVARDDQKLQMEGTATYRVRKPDAFVIDIASDSWNRRFFYNGKEFTLYAPKLGYFSSWPAPNTIQATIADVEQRFGISIPLDDLFRWSGPDGARADSLQSAFKVGVETIDGARTDHYAFRDGDIDWQIWIQQGPQPLPRKLLIVDRRDPTLPAYVARLAWTLNPPLADDIFTFRPGADAKRIRITLNQ